LCVLQDANAPETGEDCFQPLALGDGSNDYKLTAGEKKITTTVKLPDGLTCERCVLRWTYTAGINILFFFRMLFFKVVLMFQEIIGDSVMMVPTKWDAVLKKRSDLVQI
jgi:hypothetical protein